MPLHRKDDKKECTNYREKIYETILTDRLKEEVENEIDKGQNGFRAGRETTGATFIIKQLIKRPILSNKKNLHLLYQCI